AVEAVRAAKGAGGHAGGPPPGAHPRLSAENVPAQDATGVERLETAGAIQLGKLTLYELAGGTVDPSDEPPPATNPWNSERVAGGSSSGAAVALAAGLCSGANGADTGGSVRAPAAYFRVGGLEASYGRGIRARWQAVAGGLAP